MAKKKASLAHTPTLAYRRLVIKPPEDEEEQNALANELIAWAKNNDVYAIEEFPISKSMAPRRFYAIATTNEYFADALDLARYIIGCRLQRGLRDRKLDRDYVLRLLPLYNEDYKDLLLAKVKESEAAKNGRITVIIPPFSSSEETTERTT